MQDWGEIGFEGIKRTLFDLKFEMPISIQVEISDSQKHEPGVHQSLEWRFKPGEHPYMDILMHGNT